MIESIRLIHFRNYTHSTFHFEKGLNLIVGKNGAGKTNLLEALFFLSTGRSFRTHQFHHLVQEGAKAFTIEVNFVKDQVRQTLKVTSDGKTKKVWHNDTPSGLLGILPAVLHAPRDIDFIAGAPSERRRFFNLHIAQSDRAYVEHLYRYDRAMQQRNALLKEKRFYDMSVWESEMDLSALYLQKARRKSLQVFDNELFKIAYTSSYTGQLKEVLAAKREREAYLGSTLYGPHRDDYTLEFKGRDVKSFASEGEKRLVMALLRLSQWRALQTEVGHPPLFGIDDFGIHLDQLRREEVEKNLNAIPQLFISTPHPEILQHLTPSQIIPL